MTIEETQEILGIIFCDYYTIFLQRAMKITRSMADAEDVVQDTMEKMMMPHILYKLSAMKYEEIKAYILRSVNNTAISTVRKVEYIELVYEVEMKEEDAPEEKIIQEENENIIWDAILELPYKERELLKKMSERDDYTYIELAKELGIDRKTVAKRHQKAKELLKEKLRQKGKIMK